MSAVRADVVVIEDELVRAFDALTLDPAQFTHRAHLSVAWRYLQRHGFPDGAVRFREQLLRYIDSVGAQGKYHETITWAYMVLLNEELGTETSGEETFDELVARRPDLLDHRSGAIAACYSREELARPEARRTFILPRSAKTAVIQALA
jgi:hypothetical protein